MDCIRTPISHYISYNLRNHLYTPVEVSMLWLHPYGVEYSILCDNMIWCINPFQNPKTNLSLFHSASRGFLRQESFFFKHYDTIPWHSVTYTPFWNYHIRNLGIIMSMTSCHFNYGNLILRAKTSIIRKSELIGHIVIRKACAIQKIVVSLGCGRVGVITP